MSFIENVGQSTFATTMSNTILNIIPSPFMSALTPDIRIQTTNPYVDVAFWSGNRTLLMERYDAYNGYVTLHDLRSLIEAEMRSAGSALMTFILKAYKDTQTNEADTYTFTVLYCDRYIAEGYPNGFITENFLTTLPTHRIGTKTHITLGYFLRSGDSTALRIDFLYRVPGGGIETGIYTRSGGTVTADRVYYLDLLQQELLESVAERERCKWWELSLLQATLRIGDRTATFFVDPALDTALRFMFRNAFNVYEVAELPCKVTVKTAVDRSLAILGGESQFYGQTATVSHEVETGALTEAEAEWLTQLFTSHEVYRWESDPNTDDPEPLVWRPVLITDVNSETTYDEEPPTVKFTWRYAYNHPLLTLPTSPGIFTSPYNPVYS